MPLHSCVPIFCVASVNKSLDYYARVLGFTVAWRWAAEGQFFFEPEVEGEVGFAMVSRDEMQLMLAKQSQGAPGMWLHLNIEDPAELDALHAEWSKNGAKIVEAPANRPWGNYEMHVADLDGHVMRVACSAKE